MLQRTVLRATRTSARYLSEAQPSLQIPQTLRPVPLQYRSLHQSRPWRAEDSASTSDAAQNADQSSTTAQGKPKEEGAQDANSKELESKKREVLELTDKWKRSIAEYRNLQEQTRREVTAAREFAIQRFAKDLIESVDNLDRALDTVPKDKLNDENKDLKALHDGLRMTETIMLQTMKKHGLERFDPSEAGDKFDPNKHEATFQVPQPDKENNTVFHTQQKGFLLNGRVLRAAKVGVVKNE